MSRAPRLPAALGALLLIGLTARPAAAAEEARPLRVTIAFTGDVGGYLEPCG